MSDPAEKPWERIYRRVRRRHGKTKDEIEQELRDYHKAKAQLERREAKETK